MKNKAITRVRLTSILLSSVMSISGCSTIYGASLGKENVLAAELLGENKHEEALKVLRRAKHSSNSKYRLVSLKLEAAVLIGLAREEEATDLYQEILNSPEAKEDGLTQEELDKLIRNLASESDC
jgi:hypothetical protein